MLHMYKAELIVCILHACINGSSEIKMDMVLFKDASVNN